MNKLKLAKKISFEAHKGQVDKGGIEYWRHPHCVAQMCKGRNEKIVAYLHDVVEDTSITVELLKLYGFSDKIIKSVKAITHNKSEDYETYMQQVMTDKTAMIVKLADLRHNSELFRIPNPTEKDIERCEMYKHYVTVLRQALDNKYIRLNCI